MLIGVPAETYPGECRVALVPAVLPSLAKLGLEILLEPAAGAKAGFPDSAYTDKGAKLAADHAEIFSKSDIVALFQHFSFPEVVRHQIERKRGDLASQSLLGQLAQEFGYATGRRGAFLSR